MKEIKNPFIISEKVVPELFCDRKEESQKLCSLIENGNNVVLISHRRVGKTGLIQYCYDRKQIKSNYLTFYIDILSTNNLQEFTYLLSREIVSVIRPFGKKVIDTFLSIVKSLSGKVGYDAVSGTPAISFQLGEITNPDHTLKEIFEYLSSAQKPCLVAIDEFQQIAKYSDGNVEALLRSHILQTNNCRFVFSGSERHLLEEMFISPARPFYNSCALISLNVIERATYIEFIQSMFSKYKKRISKELAERIYDMFDGITFYVQRICNGVFTLTPEGSKATDEMVSGTLETNLYSYDTIFRERLYRLTTRQKELLFAIASEGKVDRITSREFIQNYALGTSSAVQTSLKALFKMDLLDKEFGKIFIPEKFFYLWLKKNYLFSRT